jgi:hypothetical protein
MEFLNPAALYGLFFLPLLLLAYLIRGRPRRVVFSSLLLLREFRSRSSGSRWGKLQLPPIFFLQLLLLLLLILALGEPVFSTRPLKIAVVFDNSASMQAIEGQKKRFEIAQEEAQDLLQSFSSGTQIDLYVSVPRLERTGPEGMAPAKATSLLRTLSPYDMGDPPGALGEELSRLVKEKNYERLFFLTDHPLRGQSGAVKVITVGRTKNNLALTSFQLSRASLTSSQLDAKLEVVSFSSRDERVRVALKAGEKVVSTRELTLAAGKSATVSFGGVPPHPYFEAEIDAKDALSLDNRRYAAAPSAEGLKVLAVSPRPQALNSLRSIPGLNLKLVSPDGYAKSAEEGHALEIFHFSAPAVLPRRHALFVLPPKNNPLVVEERSLSRPVISSWRDPHPLTRYVNFALFSPNFARTFKPLLSGEPVIKSPEGPLMMAFEYHGYRYLVLGFDPFPYLGQQNLPVSILTLNMLGWFYEFQGNSGVATGTPLELESSGATVVTPKQDKVQVKESPALFSRTFYQGLYQIVRPGKKEFAAVNLNSVQESDLNNPTPIEMKEVASALGSRSFLFPVWPYVLLLSILLFFLEWYLNPPVRQS